MGGTLRLKTIVKIWGFLGGIVLFFLSTAYVWALPYLPGQTLDPSCSPTTTNCTVIPPAQAGLNVDIFQLAPTNSLILTPGSGRVGINTVNPQETLDVAGAIKLGNTTQTLFGTIRWTGVDFEGYGSSGWKSLTSVSDPLANPIFNNVTVTGLVSSSQLVASTATLGNVIAGDIAATSGTFSALGTNNLSATLANISGVILGNATATNFIAATITASNTLFSNVIFESATGTNLLVLGSAAFQGVVDLSTTTISQLTVTGASALSTTTATALSVTDDVFVAGNLTTQNLSATAATATTFYATTGTFANVVVTNPVTYTNLLWTNATGTNLYLTGGTSTNFFATNLSGTNGAITQVLMVSATSTNLAATNLTATNGVFTSATTTNLAATVAAITNATLGTVTTTNLIVTTLGSTNATLTNATATNFFANNAQFSAATTTNLVAAVATFSNLLTTLATTTNLVASTATIGSLTATSSLTTPNLTFTAATGTTLYVTGTLTAIGNTNLVTTTITALTVSGLTTLPTTTVSQLTVTGNQTLGGALTAATVSSTNLSALSALVTNVTSTNLVATNLTTQNLSATAATATTFYATTGTFANVVVTNPITYSNLLWVNATGTNVFVSNATTTNFFASTLGANSGSITNLLSVFATSTNLVATNFSGTNGLFTSVTSTNLAATVGTLTSVMLGSATATTFFATTGTFTNIVGTNAVLTSLTTTNFSATNVNFSGLTLVSVTSSNLFATTAVFVNASTTNNQAIGGSLTVAGQSTLATTTISNVTVVNTSTLGEVVASGNVVVGAATRATNFNLEVNGDIGPRSAPTRVTSTLVSVAVDSTGSVGQYISVGVGGDNLPVMAYYDATNLDLKYAKCNDASCSSKVVQTLDSTGDVGSYVALKVVDGTKIAIAYHDTTNGDLKYIYCTSLSDCAGTATVRTIDSTGVVGQYTSLVIVQDGTPVISYFDVTNSDLKVAKCNDVTCAASTITSVDTTGAVGQYTASAIGSDGDPVISYYDPSGGNLKMVKCGNYSCSAGNTITAVESTNDVGRFTSISVGIDGLPFIAHYSVTNLDIRVIKCGNTACSAGNTATAVDTAGSVGQYTSVAFGAGPFPIISYYDATNGDLKVAACGNSACSSANTITSVETINNVGQFSSLTVTLAGLPVVAFYDSTNLDARVVTCGVKDCAHAGGIFSGGSNLGSREKSFNDVFAVNFWAREGVQVSNFDLAESYLITDQTIEGGDVVKSATNTAYALEKTTGYTDQALGVISTKPGVVLSDWISKTIDAAFIRPLALAGRVPVKVSAENGPIAQGDLLVPSSLAGVAMKACGVARCAPAFVVGAALESFDPPRIEDVGAVTMIVRNQWFVPTDRFSAFRSHSAASSTSSSVTFISRGESDYLVAGADQAGFATVKAGDSSVDVVFSEPFSVSPVITVSLASDVEIQRSHLGSMSKRGFKISIYPRAPADILFTWHALGVKNPVNFYGNQEIRSTTIGIGLESDYAQYYGRTTGVVAGTSEGVVVPVLPTMIPVLSEQPNNPPSTTSTSSTTVTENQSNQHVETASSTATGSSTPLEVESSPSSTVVAPLSNPEPSISNEGVSPVSGQNVVPPPSVSDVLPESTPPPASASESPSSP